jgi:hypothetical protein
MTEPNKLAQSLEDQPKSFEQAVVIPMSILEQTGWLTSGGLRADATVEFVGELTHDNFRISVEEVLAKIPRAYTEAVRDEDGEVTGGLGVMFDGDLLRVEYVGVAGDLFKRVIEAMSDISISDEEVNQLSEILHY